MVVVSLLCARCVSQSVPFFRSGRLFPSVAARVLVGAESDGSVTSDALKQSKTFTFAYVWSPRAINCVSVELKTNEDKFWKIKKK